MSRRGEKPWKPYPPRRSVSLNKADVVKGQTSDIAKRTSSKAKDNDDLATTVEPGPAIVSVVPVDVSGRSFARLRNQPKKMKAPEEEAPLNGSIARRVSARYSTLLDSSNYGRNVYILFGVCITQGHVISMDNYHAKTCNMQVDIAKLRQVH